MPGQAFSFVDRVAALLPATLVGNSFGGQVALSTTQAHRDKVDRLVLIAPSLRGWRYGEEMRGYFEAEDAAVEAGDLDFATEMNLRFWVAPEHHDLVRPLQRRALELQTAHPEPEVRWPSEEPLSLIQVPTLVVIGECDKEDFRAIARHIVEQIPSAQLVEIRQAGHLVGIEQPVRLNELLLEFLGRESG
jgi:pimeloyl-ACP methyl ester carboxylesterase